MTGRELDVDAILAGLDEELPAGHRAGMVALVGRPNVGKSTLLNALVGEKVAIVTEVPGTTRNAIRGVVTRPDSQLVFLDTPGIAKPRTLLARRLNELVRDAWTGVDVIAFLVDAPAGIGAGDRFLAQELESIETPVVCVVTKEDLVPDKHRLIPVLDQANALGRFAEVVPVSAVTGMNVPRLMDVLAGYLPEGPRIFPTGMVSDQPERQLAAEILREKLIRRMGEEVPHSIMVTVERLEPSAERDDMIEVDAVVHVERDSQKGIVIGKGGRVIRDANTEARQELERILGAKVFLDTRVRVTANWQKDPKALGRFGY